VSLKDAPPVNETGNLNQTVVKVNSNRYRKNGLQQGFVCIECYRTMRKEQADIIICPMTATELDEVLAIESVSYPHPWNTVHFLDELNSHHSFPLVALNPEGVVLGYICPMLVLDEGHILNVAVGLPFRGMHVGKLLVEHVLTDCLARGASFVSLEVRVSNTAAIALYERLGFIETGRRKNYYENGEDAILMEYIYTNGEVRGDAV
jgi:ribosomal-protein-alanine N-acetyltransferase